LTKTIATVFWKDEAAADDEWCDGDSNDDLFCSLSLATMSG